MKATILSACLLLIVATASAQIVDFRNNQNDFRTPADRDVYSGTELIPLVGTNFQARLLYGSDASSLQPATYITPARFRNVTTGAATAGTWVGGNRTLVGLTVGQVVTLKVQVWDAGPGPNFRTFEEVRAAGGLWCESDPFTYTIPAPGSTPTDYYMDNLRSFCFIPEPSVFALGALGLGALLMMKRRRS